MKKILIYHWVQDNFPRQIGGGIQYYQKNQIEFLKKRTDLSIYILSSGRNYNPLNPSVRIVPLPEKEEKNISRFDLINSGIPAPAANNFGNIFALHHESTFQVFKKFLQKYGPFDVIHFHHLEGIPASVLTLKKDFPFTKFIFSMHDYYIFCPQLNFFYKDSELCFDNQSGEKCLGCRQTNKNYENKMIWTIVDKIGLNPKGTFGKYLFNSGFLQDVFSSFNFRESNRTWKPEDIFREWKQFTALINENIDQVLAVSERVRTIAIEKGIDPNKIHTLPNPIPEANKFDEVPPKKGPIVSNGLCTMVFLGYMNHVKGFYFLLDAFERMPEFLSRKINLVIPARKTHDPETINRLEKLRQKLNSLILHDGYKQTELDQILENCDVGLLCHIWEDNAPMTVRELHVRRIPFLTSHLGGTQEISNCEKMVFEAGNVKDFLKKVQMILDGEITHEEYWKNSFRVPSLEEHFEELLKGHYFNDI